MEASPWIYLQEYEHGSQGTLWVGLEVGQREQADGKFASSL